MARRADHTKEELKSIITDAAWNIAGKGGAEALTARKIAEEIGYAPGTIYNNFKSMDDICLCINAHTLDILYEALSCDQCTNPSRPLLNNLKTMASVYTRFAQEYKPYWLMLFSSQIPESRTSNEWYKEKIERLFDPLEELLGPLFPSKQKKKKRIATRTLWASIHGLCFLQETGRMPDIDGQGHTQAMAHYLIETYIAGIQKESAQSTQNRA